MRTLPNLVQDALKRSFRERISRKKALFIEVMSEPLSRESTELLFLCALDLLPHFEPNKLNARYIGKRRNRIKGDKPVRTASSSLPRNWDFLRFPS